MFESPLLKFTYKKMPSRMELVPLRFPWASMGEHGCLAITFGQQMGNIFRVASNFHNKVAKFYTTKQPKFAQ